MSETFSKLISRARQIPGATAAATATIAVLLLLPLVVRLDGRSHADWQQFVGRFHPLAVHLPIGLVVLVPVLEIAGARRPALREAAGFVLAMACALSLATLALGYLLAFGSGETGTTLSRHLWGGIVLAIGLLLCSLVRPNWSRGVTPGLYPALLVVVELTLIWTAHQGGSLTHGNNYLTQFMPDSMKRIGAIGSVSAAVPNSNSFYARHVHALLDSHCVSCHGVQKAQNGLHLDTYEGLLHGGKSGAAIVPYIPEKSLLLARVTLPANDAHFMPAEGRPPLNPDEVQLLRKWIEKGASPTATEIPGIRIAEQSAEPPPQPVGDYSALMSEIRQMQQSQGAKLVAVSNKPSDGLILNTFDVAATFSDAQLAQMLKFAPFIVEADLARTPITDASLETLSHFSHLRVLHLEGTAIRGDGLGKLATLSQLNYLNLSETRVTGAAVARLKSMPNLHHIYLFDTPAQPTATDDPHRTAGGTE